MREHPPEPRHPEAEEQISHRLRVAPAPAVKRPVPRARVRPLSEVFMLEDLEARLAHGRQRLGRGDHVRDAVTLLDADADLAVREVGVVVVVCHHPLVDAEDAAWLKGAEDLGVGGGEVRGVDGCLDGVRGVKGGVGEGEVLSRPRLALGHVRDGGLAYHKVALHELQLVLHPNLPRIPRRPLHLVLIDIYPRDVTPRELCNLARRPADAAAHIQNLHIPLNPDGAREVVLVAYDSLHERFAEGGAVEVEALAEAELVEVCGEVVIPG